MLTGEMITLIERFPLGMVATVRPEGGAAVSPKGTFRVISPTELAFAVIRSPGTVANIAEVPGVEVGFLDPFARKAVRARGVARTHRRGQPGYLHHFPAFEATWPDLAPRMSALVTIALSKVEMVWTPPYDDGATEAEMIDAYKAKYGDIYP